MQCNEYWEINTDNHKHKWNKYKKYLSNLIRCVSMSIDVIKLRNKYCYALYFLFYVSRIWRNLNHVNQSRIDLNQLGASLVELGFEECIRKRSIISVNRRPRWKDNLAFSEDCFFRLFFPSQFIPSPVHIQRYSLISFYSISNWCGEWLILLAH